MNNDCMVSYVTSRYRTGSFATSLHFGKDKRCEGMRNGAINREFYDFKVAIWAVQKYFALLNHIKHCNAAEVYILEHHDRSQ
jgi:hypothetical protein